MADFTVTFDRIEVQAAHDDLWPAIAKHCLALFPTNGEVSHNNTRVSASFVLGEDVHARFVLDVDPVRSDEAKTVIYGSFNVFGRGLRDADHAEVQAMCEGVFNGVRAVIARRLAELRGMSGHEIV